MKIAPSAYAKKAPEQKPAAKTIITLVPEEHEDELRPEQTAQFSLFSQPNDNTSANYKTSVRVLQGGEAIRTIVQWLLDTQKVLHGLNVTTYEPSIPIVEALLSGMPLILFQAGLQDEKRKCFEARIEAAANNATRDAIRTAGVDHADNTADGQILSAMQYMAAQSMPRNALARVKRFLRRDCRKPVDMKVRAYLQHILRINMELVPNLSPFDPDQALGADELVDILLFGTPKSWQKEMERQGFDPIANSANRVIEFMERIEATEDFNDNSTKVKKPQSNKKKATTKSHEQKLKVCSHHGPNPSHTSEECYVLHPELKPKGKNKSWTRKASENRSKTKQDLAAFVKKEVAKGVKKSLDKSTKKRKEAESESDEDLNAFDLKDFNYDDMDNLKIDSDNEISV